MVGRTKSDASKPVDKQKSKPKPEDNQKSNAARAKISGRPKSPGRTKNPGRTKSPGRTSPARTQTEAPKARPPTPTRAPSNRTKSPGRQRTSSPKTLTPIRTPSRRSPIRRSPARAVKEASMDKDAVRDRDLRPKKQILVIDTDTDSDNAEYVPEVKEKPKAAVRGRTRKIDVETTFEDKFDLKANAAEPTELTTFGLTRRFTRSSQVKDLEKVVHLKHFDSVTVTKRLGEFSDEDELQTKRALTPECSSYPEHKKYMEFGGTVGAFINLPLLPLLPIALFFVCDETRCSFNELPDLKRYANVGAFFDARSFLGVAAFVTLMALLAGLPYCGKRVPAMPGKHPKFFYQMNGMFSFAAVLLIFCGLEVKNIPVANFVVDHIFQLLIASITFTLALSLFLYVRSFYVPLSALNVHVAGKGRAYGFVMGREVNPRLFGYIDLKLVLFRVLLIGLIFFDFVYLYKSLDWHPHPENTETSFDPRHLNLQPTLLTYVLLHTIYLLDPLIFESTWATSFTAQHEGLGYQMVGAFFTGPFIHGTVVKYIAEHGVEMETWQLILAAVNFAIGYVVCRGSDNQKDAFRRNPYGPSLSHLETIPTTTGKKLLASGFWGIVRHPNYFGCLIINLTWVPFVLRAPPVLTVLLTFGCLAHRAYRLDSRCRMLYGAAWDRYCARVRYSLIPKVY